MDWHVAAASFERHFAATHHRGVVKDLSSLFTDDLFHLRRRVRAHHCRNNEGQGKEARSREGLAMDGLRMDLANCGHRGRGAYQALLIVEIATGFLSVALRPLRTFFQSIAL
jgi:hypothetical protein